MSTATSPAAPATPHIELDAQVREALGDPDLERRFTDDPPAAAALVSLAGDVARRAFDEGDEDALRTAHRAMYALHAQSAWSPVDAVRVNEHDVTLAAVLRELERGFERELSRFEVPSDMPDDPALFGPWLTDLALSRDLPQIPATGMGPFIRDEITLDQLREIVAQRSLFFLKEPDPWAMVIPSLRGKAKAGLLDLLLDEYGWGRHDHMHSTVYEVLMERLGLDTGYDAYFDRTAWQFLAGMNLQGMYARHRRLCRRMYGYIYLVEADSPDSMRHYLAGWERLGVEDPAVTKFYELHVTADEGHQEVALDELIGPVVADEPDARADIARGVVEGRAVHALFGAHLRASFVAGRSSMSGAR